MGAQGRWREDQEDQARGNVWFKRCQPTLLPELPPHLDGLHLLRTVLALLLPPPTYPTSSVLGPQSPLLQPHPLTSPHSLQPGAPAPDGALFSAEPLHGKAPAGSSPGIRRPVLVSPPAGQPRHGSSPLPYQSATVLRS